MCDMPARRFRERQRRRTSFVKRFPCAVALLWCVLGSRVVVAGGEADAPLCVLDTSPLERLPRFAAAGNHSQRRLFDIVTYAYEKDLLHIRVTELQNVVHAHFVSVCNVSFSALPLTLDTNFTSFGALADKIHVVHCGADYPTDPSPWPREGYARKNVLDAVKPHLRPNDVVIVSDVDEIPSAEVARELLRRELGNELVHLRMPLWRYTFGCVDPDLAGPGRDRCGPLALAGARAVQESGDKLRNYGHECSAPGVQVFCAGWHCSSCLPSAQLRDKFAHFSHANDGSMKDYNAAVKANLSILEGHMRGCRSPQDAGYQRTTKTRGLPEAVWAGHTPYLLPLQEA